MAGFVKFVVNDLSDKNPGDDTMNLQMQPDYIIHLFVQLFSLNAFFSNIWRQF